MNIDEIIQQAEVIRTNVAPDSNTAELVGATIKALAVLHSGTDLLLAQLQEIVEDLEEAIDPSLAQTVAQLQEDLQTEISNRMAECQQLSGQISTAVIQLTQSIQAEASARDAAITAEQNARTAADTNLQTQINSEVSNRQNDVRTLQEADAAMNVRIGEIGDALDDLMNGDVSSAIESFNEVIAFLEGITDDETLVGKLSDINTAISGLTTSLGNVTTNLSNLSNTVNEVIADNLQHHLVRFAGIIKGQINIETLGTIAEGDGTNVYWSEYSQCFVIFSALKYYRVWANSELWRNEQELPYPDKFYLNGSGIFAWDASSQKLKQLGGSSVSSIFNATNEVPIQGYYVLVDTNNPTVSAVHAAWNLDKAVAGLIISFEIAAGMWKTYQYIGRTVTLTNWINSDNWKDFGSLAAGSEPYIIIDSLIGPSTVGSYYTLATAVQALQQFQQTTGVNYAKTGLIISYGVGENEMETKQFQGNVDDFGQIGLWKDFGGGTDVEVYDDPEEGGKDAFSTGGAYNLIPAGMAVDTETEGVVKLQLMNAGDEPIGDEIQFNVGSGGGGGGGGTTIAVAYRTNPLYGSAGGSFIVQAAIMSVTKAGSQESLNSIQSVVFVNRTTKRTVAAFNPRQTSSSSLSDFSFTFDLSSLATSAGEVPLQAIVTDDGGNTATKNISLIAVDVTCESTQTLNYTRDTTLEVGGPAKNIPMYRFPNNASDKGILATIEIYKNGAWEVIGTPTITDTYSHNVLVNPSGLAHGAYPIRIQGEDISSHVRGNVLHTSVMVIQQDDTHADYNKPIVAARWSDKANGTVAMFDTINMDVAVFKRDNAAPSVQVVMINETQSVQKVIGEQIMLRNTTYTISKRLTEYREGDDIVLRASCGVVAQPEDYELTISGSLIPAHETEGEFFEIDFAGRSNADSDKSITAETSDHGQVEIELIGSNYSTNGFVKDSFGTPEYGTVNDKGRMALRVAENVTATSTICPFSNDAIETNGCAISFTTQVKNVADREVPLLSCQGANMGFILTGEKLLVYTAGGSGMTDPSTSCTVPFSLAEVHRFDIVVEPSARAPYGGIGVIRVFKDGDEAGVVKYTAGAFPTTDAPVALSGVAADLYLYNIKQWPTYYGFVQAFNNYVVNLTDTEAMISEYDMNDVMVSQTAEGTTKERPSMQKCLDAGLCVVVLTKAANTPDTAENYPDYLEGLDGDKKTTIPLTWYCYFPDRPWQNCIIEEDPTSNQGTTSSYRPIKNKKAKHKKSKGMRLMYTRAEIAAMYPGDEDVLAKYDLCAQNATKNRLQISEGSQFTNITTIKVDYSDSCGAHNGAMMELMNETQLALGENYMTPSQVFNEGDFEIHTSIDSIPCALFRTDHNMGPILAVDPANAYFHAKANFNADKGDAKFFGFEDVKGYNENCLNYGDFIEMVAAQNQTLSAFKTQVLADTSSLLPGRIYVLSEFNGPGHVVLENDGSGHMAETGAVASPTVVNKTLAEVLADDVSNYKWDIVYYTIDSHYVQYTGGSWIDTTGAMTYNATTRKWSVSGRVVNPVECYELLKYDSLCWFQGVNSIADMMTIDSATGAPIWMSYFESRYPDDDDLNELYEQGRKAPYNLYRWLRFCQDCNQNLNSSDGNITLDGSTVSGTVANRLRKWEHELWMYANPYSSLCYTVASDYKAAVDQRSKNAMLSFYLDTNGYTRMYMNHWYDGDCVDGSDNDCGLTIPWDMDARTSHLYQGWDSVLFHQVYAASTIRINSNGDTITLQSVANAMRRAERNNIKVFSVEGCRYFWVTKRLSKWAKVISAFDGERKYIENSTEGSNYFYALHGLRLDDLPDYQRKRFKRCDGQYQVGDLYVNPFSARMMGRVEITITAAADGFFGIGEDRADTCADSVHLSAGESATLRVGDAPEAGKMIYLFGADNLSKIDISKCSPKNAAWNIENCTLLEELIIGGTSYSPAYELDILSALNLGAMPFLKKVDIRNTRIVSLNADKCPRLQQVYAEGSPLTSFTAAESSPISLLHLPATMTALRFINLPNLTYPNGSLTIAGTAAVSELRVEGCQNIDAIALLSDVVEGSQVFSRVRIANQTNMRGDGSELKAIVEDGVAGWDETGTQIAKPAVSGNYGLTELYESYEVEELEAAIYGLVLITIVEAFITLINRVNGEEYGGDAEVATVTLENIDALAFNYYNGETYEDYLSDYALQESDVNDLVNNS